MEKTVLITGASSGIGAACARVFAGAGYRVAVCYCTQRAAAEALCTEFPSAHAFCVDVADEQSVMALFEAVQTVFGGVDILLNNAGVARQALVTDMTAAAWDEMFAVHVRGAFLCCRAALPHMIRQKYGCIINMASMWGQVGASCEVAYSAAKAALIGLTKALAKEEGPSGITVNCIAPGVIETPMLGGFSAADKTLLAEETPLCRLGMPGDVANAAMFLASDAATFITGQVLGVNGGFVV